MNRLNNGDSRYDRKLGTTNRNRCIKNDIRRWREVKPLSIEWEKLAPYLTYISPLNSGLSRVARCTTSGRVAICHFFAVKSQTMLASLGIIAEKATAYKEVLAPKIKSILQ